MDSTFSLPRFHKLAWSSHGQEGVNACGIIAGGSDNGTISLWSADKIIRYEIVYIICNC